MSENPIFEWQAITLPVIDPAAWPAELVGAGLRELRRIRAQLDAAQAVLVGLLAASAGRDTRARLARELSMSGAEASQAAKVAGVVGRVPGALAALERGDVSADKLARIAPITDPEAAAALLAAAGACSPEELTKAVDRQRLRAEGGSWRERQRRKRFLSFFRDPDGCIGLRGLLPTADGERVKASIESLCEERFRREHPERARAAGEMPIEPRDRRLADALVEAVCGRRAERDETGSRAATRSGAPADGADAAHASDAPAADGAGTPAAGAGDAASSTPAPTRCEEATSTGAAAARTALIVTVDAETLDAQVVSGGVVSLDDVADLVSDARTDVYALVRDMRGVVLKFGRSRRLASALQRLVLAVRDGGCSVPGCSASWQQCDAHHEPPFEQGGRTDVDRMDLRCKCEHHPHRHEQDGGRTRASPGRSRPPRRAGPSAGDPSRSAA